MIAEHHQKTPASESDKTRQRIIEAALRVFSERGYNAATTRTIAAAADVNEVTLFRHFGSKQNLLVAVIDQYSSLSALTARLEAGLTGDYYEDLMRIVQDVLLALTRGREIVQLILSDAQRQPRLQEMAIQVSRQACQVLERYLRRQMERGLVRQLDPQVAARVFFGMLFTYVLARDILGESASHVTAPPLFVTQFVDIFVQGTLRRDG